MDRISFTVNGVKCYVGSEVSSGVTLLDYLRNYLELRGTKYMCREGGCGACIVSAVKSPGEKPSSVNACLVSITSCYNWEITTIEKVGNRHDGYHPIQTHLAENNGTQCGFCTPGWVMAMYNLLQNEQNLTMKEIEQSFASNICRCTGYRPILDAFKKFAKDSPKSVLSDMEDLQICKKKGEICTNKCCDDDDWCIVPKKDVPNILEIDLKDGKRWYRVSTIKDIFEIWNRRGVDSYMLVAGNTAKGVVPIDDYPPVMIDISGVSELKGYYQDQNLVINAGTTLTELLDIFLHMSQTDADFTYMKTLYEHLRLVAHIPVRNIGTIAGNLMIKHQYNSFASDIFLLLETVGGQITICKRSGAVNVKRTLSVHQFLKTNMSQKVIVNVLFPPLNSEYHITTYKIMPRTQNAHAFVNAGFVYQLKQPDNIVRQSRIVFSGLVSPSSRASATEKFLFGKKLFTDETLQGAIKILDKELHAVENPPEPSAEYRKQLALGLFYKGLLNLCPENILNKRYTSGSTEIHQTRPVSDGRQIFSTNPKLWPLNQPLQKVEALRQCAAEVPYTEDLPSFPHEVFAEFVLSTEGTGTIQKIDASEALKLPGVIGFYTAEDIPGLNSFTPADAPLYVYNEEILSDGTIKYCGQPIGIIVADSRYLAQRATKLVRVTYKNVKEPVIDIRVAKNDPSRLTQYASSEATNKGSDVDKVIKGDYTIFSQYHFPIENLVCVTQPSEDGFKVYSSTQWMDGTQLMISRALNLDINSIDVYVSRVGGSYGMKISRASQVATACCLVSWKLNRPCRFIQSLTTTMKAVGKRLPCSSDFEVAVSKDGEIQHVDCKLYEDNGYVLNEQIFVFGADLYANCYDISRWTFNGYDVITDTHKNTFCRSPGTLENTAVCEMIIERISYEQDIDPVKVRLANLDTTKYNDLVEMWNYMEEKSDYKNRRAAVDKFNSSNRWKKRGLRVSFMRWTTEGAQRLNCNISVYHGDGTVAIVHSGIEMGQGINTKAVQVAAYKLNISTEKIKIKGSNSIAGPNAYITGGSIGTQNVCIAVEKACDVLLSNIQSIKDSMPDATWEEIVTAAYNADIDLQGHGFIGFPDQENFTIYGIAVAEVEVDILTGQSEIIRVDLLEDAGRPINPELDVGQVEGAFMMSVGYWTCEHLVYNPEQGEIITDRTWHYHVPQARDIPQDFRVYLRPNSYSSDAILGAKCVGEAPMCSGIVIALAIREAIAAARVDAGKKKTEWFPIDGPYTLEQICLNTATKPEHFKLIA